MESQQEDTVVKHQHTGGAGLVVAAIILGGCVLGAGFLMAQATERAGDRIVAGIADQVKVAMAPDPAPRREARPRRGPDPDKRYSVDLKGAPAMGPEDATVTVVEFSDFQCPFCARVMPTLKRVKETYGDQVQIVWKNFPLTAIHPQAFGAAQAGQCAQEQGMFWEYHDRLFANQQALEPDSLKTHAAAVGLDAAAFSACLDTAKYADLVQEQMGIGTSLGVSSTPTVFINGRLVSGAQPYAVFVTIIDEELERAASR